MLYNAGKTNSIQKILISGARNQAGVYKRSTSIILPREKDCLELVVSSQNLVPTVETLMWRLQTSLPIVSVKEVTVFAQERFGAKYQLFHISKTRKQSLQNLQKQNNPMSKIHDYLQMQQELSSFIVQVKIEDIQYRLSQINMLPLAQIIFLLKEMLIGFEALIDIFGFFKPRDPLVAVTPQGQWKLWIDQNYGCQQKKQCNLNEKQFIYMLLSMAENHCLATSQSRTFFTQLKEYISTTITCSFIKILQQINKFVYTNKIYQVSRVTITPASTKKKQVDDKNDQRQQSPNKRSPFNNPFINVDSNRQKSLHKIDKSKSISNVSFGQFSNRRVSFKDNNQKFLSLKISPITSPLSPNISLNPTFSELSQKWTSNAFTPPLHSKPTSQISKPQKRPNMRNNSYQMANFQSFQHTPKQKYAGSTICNISFGEEMPPQTLSLKHKRRQYSSHQELQNFNSLHNPSLSPQNSSSTKEMRQDDDRYDSCNYNSLKKKDLGNGRFKNNKSLISNEPQSRLPKQGMTVSHQFNHIKRSESDDMSPAKTKEEIWVNKIEDLFSDTKSIKQLKGSIKLRNQQQQPFQKEYLKDVKLDLLQKFGRKVNAPITIDEEEVDYPLKKQEKHLNYRSMQLIEQQLQEVISHVEEDQKSDDIITSPLGSRRQTQYCYTAQKQPSYKDDFMRVEPRVAQSHVLNLQTVKNKINQKNLL